MQFRIDEKSGNKLSVLGFGCMRFPRKLGVTDMKETERLIMRAIERGVNYFDTAYIYPGSEEVLGEILAKNNVRDKIFIATKLPLILCKSGQDFDKFFDKELERLRTDHIDYYLMHMITDTDLWKKLCSWGIEDWIAEKKKSGKIRQVGFSFHGKRDEFLTLLDMYNWEFCQIQYNYSDENYQAGVAGLKRAAEKKLPVIIMEPLLGGKLVTGLPKEALSLFKKENPDLTPAAWGLRWLWNQSEVTVVLSGMNESSQLEDNTTVADSAIAGMITEQEKNVYKDVLTVFNKAYKVHCTGCNYCMPCPKNVNIPGCFASYNLSFSMGLIEGIKQYVTSTAATSATPSGASLCVQCGKCETHCPQHLPIRQSLKDVKKRIEPFWFCFIMAVARLVLGNKKAKKS